MAISLESMLLSEFVKYSDEIQERIEGVIDAVTDEAIVKLKKASPKDTTKYSRSWIYRTTYKTGRYGNTIHSKRYMLTHLLEKGHKTRRKYTGKARAKEIPHIGAVERWAAKEAEKRVAQIIKNT